MYYIIIQESKGSVVDEQNIDIEFLILADLAQVIGGKLHMMGGGWDRINVQNFPHIQSFSIATAISVPWAHTNEKHNIIITMVDEDGQQELFKIEGEFEVGRAPGIKPGSSQRLMMAFTVNSLKFSEPKVYSIISFVDGQEIRRLEFNVIPTPALHAKMSNQQQSA